MKVFRVKSFVSRNLVIFSLPVPLLTDRRQRTVKLSVSVV
jgi:hypothetical protein